VANGFKVGEFNKETSGVANTTQAITGVGFKPAAIIFFYTHLAVEGFTNTFASCGTGFTSGPSNSFSIQGGLKSGATVGSGFYGRMGTNAICFNDPINGTQNPNSVADLVSFDSDGFTLKWTTSSTNAFKIEYIAFANAGITNAFVGETTCPTTAGNVGITGVGFQPDIIFFLPTQNSVLNSGDSIFNGSLGVAMSSSKRWCQAPGGIQASMTSGTHWKTYQRTDACLLNLTTSGTEAYRADLVSMDSDGFTVNFITPGSFANYYGYLCLKGGSWDVGSFAANTSNTAQSVSGLAFQPDGAILAGFGYAASTSIQANGVVAHGAFDGTNQETNWMTATDATSSAGTETSFVTTKCYREGTTSGTVSREAGQTSLDSTGFTITWTTSNATAVQVLWVAAKISSVATTPVSQTAVSNYEALGFLNPVKISLHEARGPALNTATSNHEAQSLVLIGRTHLYEAELGVGQARTANYAATGLITSPRTSNYAASGAAIQSAISNIEAVLSVVQARAAFYEAELAAARSAISNHEARGFAAALATSNYEALQNLLRTAGSNHEAIARVLKAASSYYEALQSLARAAAQNYEARGSVAGLAVSNHEAVQALARAAVSYHEALQQATRSAGSNYEAELGIAQARAAYYEAVLAVGSVSMSRISNMEAAGPVIAARLANMEALLSAAGSRPANFEALAGLSSARVGNLEAVATISTARASAHEALARVLQARVANLEAALGISSARAAYYEAMQALGSVSMSRTAYHEGVPLVTPVSSSRTSYLEAISLITAGRPSNYEALQALLRAATTPVEALGSTARAATSNYAATLTALRAAIARYEALGGGTVGLAISNYEALFGGVSAIGEVFLQAFFALTLSRTAMFARDTELEADVARTVDLISKFNTK